MAVAREECDTEKLAEGWLHELSAKEVKKRGFLPTSDAWSQKYYVLCRVRESVHLNFFKKLPKKDEQYKKSLHLASYQVNKKTDVNKFKRYVCEVLVNDIPSYYAFETEERRDAFVFFLQTQKKLQDDITGTTFSVKPEDSPDHRKIGARGSVCYLHICSAGLTLALQVSRSIIAQWPLKCIRWYSSSDRGQFVFEAGRRAPMGEGRYSFDTHANQDTQLYDLLDKYIMDANSLWQAHSSDDFIEKKIFEDYCSLRLLALGFADMVFSRHLMRLSTCNFDDRPAPLSLLPSNSEPCAVPPSPASGFIDTAVGLGTSPGSASGIAVISDTTAAAQNANNLAKAAVLEAHSKHEDFRDAASKTRENYMDMASSASRRGSRQNAAGSSAFAVASSPGSSPRTTESLLHSMTSSPTRAAGGIGPRESAWPQGSPPKRYVRAPPEANHLSRALPQGSYENAADIRGSDADMSGDIRSAVTPAARSGSFSASVGLHQAAADSRRVVTGGESDYLYEPADLSAAHEDVATPMPDLAALSVTAELVGCKDAYEQVDSVPPGELLSCRDAAVLASMGHAPPVPTAPRPTAAATTAAAAAPSPAPTTDAGAFVRLPKAASSKQRGPAAMAAGDGLLADVRASPTSVVFTKAKKPTSRTGVSSLPLMSSSIPGQQLDTGPAAAASAATSAAASATDISGSFV